MDLANAIALGGVILVLLGAIAKQLTDQARTEEKVKMISDAQAKADLKIDAVVPLIPQVDAQHTQINTLFERHREAEEKANGMALQIAVVISNTNQIKDMIGALTTEFHEHRKSHRQGGTQ